MEAGRMGKFKIVYSWILILLPMLLVGTLGIVSHEKIIIETTNFEILTEENKEGIVEIDVYGQGFKKGDSIYIEGQKMETEVIYNKLLTFKMPRRYLQDKKIRIKVQRVSQAGIVKEASNQFIIEP